MSAYSGEKQKYVGLAVCAAASVDTSHGVGLADVHRVTVHCALKQNPATVAHGTIAHATAANPVGFTVRVGPSTNASAAALGGASLSLGATAGGNLSNWDAVQIGIVATASNVISGAHDKTVTIMGKQYTISTAAASTLSTVLPISTIMNGFGTALDTAIARDFPQLAIDVGASAAKMTSRYLRYKNVGEGKISASVTAIAFSTAVSAPFVVGLEQHGAINFQPAHVVATNSSYDSFAVRVLSTGSTTGVHRTGVAVIEPKRSGLMSNSAKIGPAT